MPINNPNGNEVSEIVLPNGNTASEVIAPDGSTVFGEVPDSVVAQYDAATFQTGDSTWVDDVGSNDASVTGDPQKTTLSNGSDAIEADGTDDVATAPKPSAFSGSGLEGPIAYEFSIQHTSAGISVPWGVLNSNTSEQASVVLNSDGFFNNQDGNIEFFLRQDINNDTLSFAPSTNPNLDDGNRHTVVINIADSSANDVSMLIDGADQSLTFSAQNSPTGFSNLTQDFGYFARNGDSGVDQYSNGKLGIIRMHNQTLSNPTL